MKRFIWSTHEQSQSETECQLLHLADLLLVRVDELITFHLPDLCRTGCRQRSTNLSNYLKVLANEKRGGLKVVAFDRSPFKLFTLKFSNKSVQAPIFERPKTSQRTLFLSFEINNCFPITVSNRRMMKKSWKLACHAVDSNIPIDSLPTLQRSLGIIALFKKIYDGEPIDRHLKHRGGCT